MSEHRPVPRPAARRPAVHHETGRVTARAATRTVTLERVALLGTFGAEGAMRALVRRGGAVERVGVGDRLGGARVVAIVPGAVRLLEGGVSRELRMPAA